MSIRPPVIIKLLSPKHSRATLSFPTDDLHLVAPYSYTLAADNLDSIS